MIAGKTIISEEVFIELAKTAMSKIETISKTSAQKNSFASIAKLVADKVAPQINVKKTDAPEQETQATVSFELKVSVLYGQNIPEAIAQVRQAVKEEVEKITGYSVEKIDVTVDKLVKPEQIAEEAATE